MSHEEETISEDLDENPDNKKKVFKKGSISSSILRARKDEDHATAVERLARYGWDITVENSMLVEDSNMITRK